MSLQIGRPWFSGFAKAGAVATTALFFVFSGCARLGASTVVKADGSFVRTVVYRGVAPSTEGFQMGPTLDELVAAPRTPGWRVTREKDPKNAADLIVTATKNAAAGETISDDIAIKAPPKKEAPQGAPPALVVGNTVTVRTLPSGQLEYREVLRWRGTRPKELALPEPELVATLKASLPPALAADRAGVTASALRIQRALWQALFGPSEPLFGLLISHPELAEHKLKKQLGGAVVESLQATFGEKLTPEARRAVAGKILGALGSNVTQKTKQQVNAGPSAASESSNEPVVALLVKAKLPGKVLQTNGEHDPLTGEIVWGMFSQAPAAGDIVLTAVCDPAG